MTMTSKLQDVPANISFPKEEEKILEYWEKIKAFETSLKKSEGRKPFSFYDGPPFATGLPHYGHLLAGTMKDIVTRYAHQTGHHVERRFGWDCHGLPIEFEIEKILGIKTREEVLKFGIANYNAECRKIVMRYAGEWRKIVPRLGRWIDFDNDYKTMNLSFMESVWWVFSELFKKGLVYRGYKVMPYSTACTTPLSNFEANLNYKDVTDPAIMVSFPLKDAPEESFIAWTTTPWTLPSNLALCMNPEMVYVKIKDKPTGKIYWVAEKRLEMLYKKKQKNNYEVLQKCKGKDLHGKRYVPLFNFFAEKEKDNAFMVITDNYVTDDSGTGIVHCAPGFGEDDYRVCLAANIIKKGEDVCPVDPNGRFTSKIADWNGKYVKDCDKDIIKTLKQMGRLVNAGSIVHSYPFCWRSETPLIYRTVPSWFVAVEKIKDKLLKNNESTYWVPSFVKEKRFHNWLENACDWAVSRSRYWGTPLPIWVSDDWEEIVCVGSVAELEELTGTKLTDIHREHIDHLTIPSKKGKGKLKRVEDVFDCWFESGSMPYAQQHYPFENKEKFEKTFPADFIAEGLDQTRGWFYTLLVLGTALFDKAPWKNLIVNGLVLAADGKKMSKRLKNYPDPMDVIKTHGADALRLYLINSPVVRAEPLKFKEEGVREVVKMVFLPWYNAYRFFAQNAIEFEKKVGTLFTSTDAEKVQSENIMDKWILSASQSLVKFVRNEMAGYRLYTVIPKLVEFIEQLTNWYVRMNRKRLKGDFGDRDRKTALMVLFNVLFISIRTMAPFTPFLTELMYQNLKNLTPEREDSIHYLMIPEYDESRVDKSIETKISRMQQVVNTGRTLRDKKGLSLKQPVREYIILNLDQAYLDDIKQLENYIKDELNCKTIKTTSEIKDFVRLTCSPNPSTLGKRLKQKFRAVRDAVSKLPHKDIVEFLKTGEVTVLDEKLGKEDLSISQVFVGNTSSYEALTVEDTMVVLDFVLDENLVAEGIIRELSSSVQQLRKAAGLVPSDKADVMFDFIEGGKLATLMKDYKGKLTGYLKGMQVFLGKPTDPSKIIMDKEHTAADEKYVLYLLK